MRTDQQIIDETNELARLCLRHIGTGYEVADGHKFYEADDPRSKTAWNMACEIQQMMTKTDPNDALSAIDPDYVDDLPTMYRLRVGVTVRAFAEYTFVASSWDEATAKAQAVKPSVLVYAYDHDDVEGDEIGYLCEAEDFDANEAEIDLRIDGEPFSWEAVRLTKDIAALFGRPWDRQTIDQLVSRAHRACTKISGGMEG